MLKIVFEFVGGPHDGRVLQGFVGEASDAERYFLCSKWGAPGQRFKVASDYAVETLMRERLKEDWRHQFQRHVYAVKDRVEESDEVWVRAQYEPCGASNGRGTSY